ncbi:uncharacterized protein LOC107043185 [Diachasma alloeum]|uniref:uncharacterized protein LOC107043185 n=1 Tax=Diachasma alloeum TaxID=454923 RepID=UPI000738443E|nr:uncharacterized protein LOC107043185 [Diachasma alloeum]
MGYQPHSKPMYFGDHRQSEKYQVNHQSEPYQVNPVDTINVLEIHGTQEEITQLVMLPMASVFALNHDGNSRPARILIDQGSEIPLVSERLVNQLHLERRSLSLFIFGIGETSSGNTRGVETLALQPRHEPAAQININAHILSKLTANIAPYTCESTIPHQLTELQVADPQFLQPGAIDIIIGADFYGRIIGKRITRFKETNLIAQQTIFGWTILGPVCDTGCAPKSSLKITKQTTNQELLELVKKFWTQEELPDTSSSSVLKKAEADSLPGRRDTASLAKKRLQKVIRRLSSDPDTHTRYKFIEEYEALNHMQRASSTSEPGRTYDLPHHAVLKPDRTITKLSVVFDASHRSSTGVSLNDILHPGPKLQVNSSDVLI